MLRAGFAVPSVWRPSQAARGSLRRTLLGTPLGASLEVTATEGALVAARFVRRAPAQRSPRVPLLMEAAAQVRAYFARKLRRFDVPLDYENEGTAFQRGIWSAVATLSFGEIVSYAEVARAVGAPLAHRGVAAAMRATPIDLFIPAHRVVGSDGRVRGCGTRSIRARLLAFEKTGRSRHPS